MIRERLQWLRSPLRFFRGRGVANQESHSWLDAEFLRIRSADPETARQWTRLQSALVPQKSGLHRRSRSLLPRLAFGAAILAAAMVGSYLYFVPSHDAADTFMTARGEHTRILLRDSSEVTLNYASELVVPSLQPGKARLLSLKGEAYFRVRRNETPFIVSTASADVRVVGTEFNVREREGTLEVAVIHGTVLVTVGRNGKDSTLTLSQHQRAICTPGGFPEPVGEIPPAEYPGWMHGKLFLDGSSFAAACREIEMRFDVAITIRDGRLRNEIVTGVLEAKTAESALAALCGLTGTKYRHEGQIFSIY